MARKKTKEQISYNMSRVRNSRTTIENVLCDELIKRGVTTFSRNDNSVYGKPDIVFRARKIAVFCDGDFWHGYDWENAKAEIKSNRDFWVNKIEKTMLRDAMVNKKLQESGWTVLRFWGHEIKKELDFCVSTILDELQTYPSLPYRTIDLCAGIGGIRKGFERTGNFVNVLSSEIDKYACKTYQHLFGENPFNDLTSDEFKTLVKETPYDILLAGFPCQTFSRVGNQEGFNNEEKGRIFFHIAKIIKSTRPMAFFLENVDRLVTHDSGETFKKIISTLVVELGDHVIGVALDENNQPVYAGKDFVRNSRDFGVPQNRPRTYIIGFDTERFPKDKLDALPKKLPLSREYPLYKDLNDVLEHDVDAHYYMASGYLETLVKHRARQEKKGYGFGYRIVNEPNNEHPIANTLLATGGSGRERNLVYDPQDGIAGMEIKGKKTKLNDQGIRVMTPTEWGKLQGFVNYAFVDENGVDQFSFPDNVPKVQKYKQFGNSVTIPVIEEMASFILKCLEMLTGM
ncbi:MAG: DNA mismatch endonuclease Vsr [Oscillospiraceae bacterium]|nr:DNA mismatch endonuclease Vsr [Oscillospiraceae bacterium]